MQEEILFKQAKEEWEFEAIHKLNYATFVEEIPQHHQNKNRMLVDKFDDQNTYIIALKKKEIVGMLALRDKRPFSLDQKIENLDSYLPHYQKICEVRLLSVRKDFRQTKILYSLLKEAFQYIHLKAYDMLVISGILEQQKLYKHIGFIPFGDVVGNGDAQFQPMYITKDSFKLENLFSKAQPLSLLPGPVEIGVEVTEAFSRRPLSHRSEKFKEIFEDTKKRLCCLVKTKNVEIFTGSGTLANDVISLELSKLNCKGLILSNGEFGERLIDHANRNGLDFVPYCISWGEAFDWKTIDKIINSQEIGWIYMVYSETSTGMINDFQDIMTICKEKEIKVCLDAISAIGNIEVDLSEIYLASGVSGKGLASFCGLSMVFYNHNIKESNDTAPKYLDLFQYAHSEGIPHTISSNLIFALHTALKNLNIDEKSRNINKLYNFVKGQLIIAEIYPLIVGKNINPSVITIPFESQYNSKKIGMYLREKGYLVSFESGYLLENNWIQLCFMGNIEEHQLNNLVKILEYAKDRMAEILKG